MNNSFKNSSFFRQVLALAWEIAWLFLLLSFFVTRIYYGTSFIRALVDLNRKGKTQYPNSNKFFNSYVVQSQISFYRTPILITKCCILKKREIVIIVPVGDNAFGLLSVIDIKSILLTIIIIFK